MFPESLVLLLACALPIYANASRTEAPLPSYPEEADGVTSVWADLGGVGWWATERAPVGDLAPVVVGVGVSHQVGVARLAWRVQLLTAVDQARPLRFLYGDLLSIERVYGEGRLRPYWRVAAGFGFDLEGERLKLGDDGYFNDKNGAAGGLAVAGGGGFDLDVAGGVFVKLDATARVHGGAGRRGLLLMSQLAAGYAW
jgi:hypothetical protein